MKRFLAFTIICALIVWSHNSKSQNFDPIYEISDVMFQLLQTAPNRPLFKNFERRYSFAEDIYKSAESESVPEFLLTIKVFNESSFKTTALALDRPSYGLGQMFGASAKGCNLKTRTGQLDCAARWLKICYDKCGTWPKALAAYGTSGYCNWRKAAKPKLYKHSIDRQINQWLEFEKQRQEIRNEIISDLEFIAEMKEGVYGKEN